VFNPAGEMNIAADSNEPLTVTLTAPSDALANTQIKLEIIGTTSQQDAKIIPAIITVNVQEHFDTTFDTIERMTLDSPLNPMSFDIEIRNDGNVDDRVELTITGIPSGLKLSQESHEFIIVTGKTESLTITMYPSSILTAGEYGLNISLYRITATGKSWVSSRNLWVDVVYFPDLYISTTNISLSKYVPYSGEDIIINVTVHNIGDSDAREATVSIFPTTRSGSQLQDIDDVVIDFIGINSSKTINVPWKATSPAVHRIVVILDDSEAIGELREDNNEAEIYITIIPPPPNDPDSTPDVEGYTIGQVGGIAVVGVLMGSLLAVAGFYASTENGKFALFNLFLPFYTRVKKEEVLNHEIRELVYDYVQSHPGEHFRAILTKLGLTNGTLIHHLQTLERQEFIKSERDGPFKRFYPSGRQFTEEVLEINGIQKKILDAVTTNPGLTQKELSNLLHTSPPTINYHVKALRGVRLINIKRDGKNTRCFPGHSLNGWYKGGVS
jgi:DNA-binding MarR family transcriptional regulator